MTNTLQLYIWGVSKHQQRSFKAGQVQYLRMHAKACNDQISWRMQVPADQSTLLPTAHLDSTAILYTSLSIVKPGYQSTIVNIIIVNELTSGITCE